MQHPGFVQKTRSCQSGTKFTHQTSLALTTSTEIAGRVRNPSDALSYCFSPSALAKLRSNGGAANPIFRGGSDRWRRQHRPGSGSPTVGLGHGRRSGWGREANSPTADTVLRRLKSSCSASRGRDDVIRLTEAGLTAIWWVRDGASPFVSINSKRDMGCDVALARGGEGSNWPWKQLAQTGPGYVVMLKPQRAMMDCYFDRPWKSGSEERRHELRIARLLAVFEK